MHFFPKLVPNYCTCSNCWNILWTNHLSFTGCIPGTSFPSISNIYFWRVKHRLIILRALGLFLVQRGNSSTLNLFSLSPIFESYQCMSHLCFLVFTSIQLKPDVYIHCSIVINTKCFFSIQWLKLFHFRWVRITKLISFS